MNSTSAASLQRLPEETVPVILPAPPETFTKRAARLHFLAQGHVIGEYLEAMAHMVEAQMAALSIFPSTDEKCAIPVPSFDACYHSCGEIFQKILQIIVAGMQDVALPKPSKTALSSLKSAAPDELDFSARSILRGNLDAIDLAAAPFLAAALQVYWTDMASRVKTKAAERISYLCPVCGSPPVAGVILSDRKLRYLSCSLCATHWYVPRLTCTNCGSTADLSYFIIEGKENGTKAEACSNCHTYLKLFYLESTPEAEAFADDLAELSLDLLMSNKLYKRNGINLFLLRK